MLFQEWVFSKSNHINLKSALFNQWKTAYSCWLDERFNSPYSWSIGYAQISSSGCSLVNFFPIQLHSFLPLHTVGVAEVQTCLILQMLLKSDLFARRRIFWFMSKETERMLLMIEKRYEQNDRFHAFLLLYSYPFHSSYFFFRWHLFYYRSLKFHCFCS